jgi:hypothetical protein
MTTVHAWKEISSACFLDGLGGEKFKGSSYHPTDTQGMVQYVGEWNCFTVVGLGDFSVVGMPVVS